MYFSSSPADSHSSGTESNSLENVRSTSHASIDHDLKVGDWPHFTLFELGNDLDEDFDTGSSEFLSV